jgi:hypothetical protein
LEAGHDHSIFHQAEEAAKEYYTTGVSVAGKRENAVYRVLVVPYNAIPGGEFQPSPYWI